MLFGFATTWPGASPVPVRDNVKVVSEALLQSAIVPLTSLAVDGVKTMLKFAVSPAETLNGRVGALNENSDVLARALLIVTEAVPLFVTVIGSALLLPTTTLPKPSAERLNCKLPIDGVSR